jgi:hypothetical protein
MNQSRDRLFSLGSGCRIDCRIVRPSETQLLGSAASAWAASAINAAFHAATRVVSYAAGSPRQFWHRPAAHFCCRGRRAQPAARSRSSNGASCRSVSRTQGRSPGGTVGKTGAGFGAGFFFFLAGITFPFFLGAGVPRFVVLDFFAMFNLPIGSRRRSSTATHPHITVNLKLKMTITIL